MSFEDTLAAVVRDAVHAAVEPLRAEVERLRRAQEDEGVTVDEAARRLDVSTKTVRRRIKDGTLPATRVGGALRVNLATVLGHE